MAMNTTCGRSDLPSLGLRLRRGLHRAATTALLAVGIASSTQSQTTLAPLSVANESPNSYNCDVYRWYDSAGKQRTAALSRNNAADPGGSRGGVLYQYRFTPAGATTERVISGTGAHSAYNGFGYVVTHYTGGNAYVSNLTTGTYTKVFTGRHHAIHQFKLTYPINGIAITATIHWYFATGQDNPVYAITYDTSAAGTGGFTVDIDSRSPYGDMQFGGDGTNPNVSGVAWGDKYKFTSLGDPVTPQSAWDYSQPNTVPYTQMWITSPDAEMGAVQTQTWLQHNTGGSWFTANWGLTSANRNIGDGSSFAGWSVAWMMPTNWQWPYQLNQYEMMDDSSATSSKRCAWGLPFGAVGSTSYDGYGGGTFSGHPFQSYSVATVIGQHSTSAVQAQVTRTERALAATLTVSTGTLVASGPGGAGRTDNVAYAKSGYNATYGAYELAANASGAFSATLASTGAITNPTFIIRGVGGIPSQISLDGTTLVADQGYYASYDSATQSVWLTVATNWTGSHTLASGAGVPPAVTVSVTPSAIALVPGGTATFSASVANAVNPSVTWSVVEAGGGTVASTGAYTAPTTTGTYHVRATSVADTSKSADASVTVASAPPAISSFQATPATITSGQSSTLSWTVTGATGLSINQSVGTVTGTNKVVSPTTTTVYTLTATGPGGTASATTGVAVGTAALAYTWVYHNALVGTWGNEGWGATVNFAGTVAGHATATKTAEVHIPGAWSGLAIGDINNWQNTTYHDLSTVKRIEFDLYVENDSTGMDTVVFVLGGDSSTVASPTVTSLLPTGWTKAKWYHVAIDLASLNPTFTTFADFVFFKNSDSTTLNPHFRLAEVKYGSVADALPPNITLGSPEVAYDQLTLPFTTSEAATYRIEYGYGNYNLTFTGPSTAATSHSAVLTGLTRSATLQFRLVATDPSGNSGYRTGSVAIVDPPPPTTATVTITAAPAATHAISPWIYGMNFYQSSAPVVRNLTLNRQGGNRWTAYNWENNASNAGADWYYHNDDYMGGGTTPGEALRPLVIADRTRGNASLLTVQMQGYVAADKNGDDVTAVTDLATRLATRFKQVVYKKPIATAGAFTTTPSATDGYVYMDEFVWALNQLVPGGIYTDPVNPTFLMLDNEPELWGSTHAEIQSGLITPADYLAKTIALSKAVKDVAPAVTLFGPVHFGFSGIYSWQGSSGFTADYWFTDRYLAELKAASATYGRRLIDVYNFNWYSEATDGATRVVDFTGSTLTDAQIQAIVQSPRSLWDPTFTEDSWITEAITGGPIRLLPRLQSKIDAIWPGTKLAITEWNNGGNNHIAGAIAIADNLGIFGQYGLFEASFWPLGTMTSGTFDGAGFRMYRDFDGALGSFGDISIPTTSSNTAKVSTYISRDSAQPGRYVIVAINRSNSAQAVCFSGLAVAGTAKLYRLTGASTTPAAIGTTAVDLSTWLLSAPAYSITTIEINSSTPSANYATWRADNFTGTDLTADAVSGPLADPDGVGLTNYARYAFGLAARGRVANPATLGTVATGGQNYLTLTFPRRAEATDLSYSVESSTDLATWTPVPGLTYNVGSDPITAQDVVALSGAGTPRRFLRIRIAQP